MHPAGVALHQSNPQEARRASRGTCVDFLQGEGISLGDGRVACLPRQSSALSAPRGPFPRGLPRRLRLGLNGIHLPNITGLAVDRSMGTLVPTGPTQMFLDVFAMAAWNIWKQRNNFYFNNVAPEVDSWKARFKDDFSLLVHRTKEDKHPFIRSLVANL